MKKIFSSLLALTIAGLAQAQISVGVEGGPTWGVMTQKIDGVLRDAKEQVGYKAGALVNIPLGMGRFNIQSGVFFNGNVGSSSTYARQSATGSGIPTYEKDSRKYNFNQLDIPLWLAVKVGSVEYDKNHFFFGLGPTFSFTVGGRYHQIYTNAINGDERVHDYDRPILIGMGNAYDIAPFNLKMGAHIGYEFGFGLFTRLQGNVGLINMHPDASINNQFNTYEIGFTVGYFFKKFDNYYRY